MNLPDLIIIVLWILQACFVIVLHSCGLFLKIAQKERNAQDCILIHLSPCECLSIIWDMIYYKQTILMTEEMSTSNYVGILVIWVAIFLSIAILTIDRLIAIKLNIKYNSTITNKTVCFALALSCIIALLHIVTYWFFDMMRQHYIFLIWEAGLLVIIIVTYIFIAVVAKTSHDNFNGQSRQLKYHVPVLIVISFVCFVSVPDVFRAVGYDHQTWFALIYNINFITDALIYIFGSPKTRQPLSSYRDNLCTMMSNRASAPQ